MGNKSVKMEALADPLPADFIYFKKERNYLVPLTACL
jgi:hypothetical protein